MSSSVLICDDSNLARKQVLRSLPEQWQVNIQTATNGREALTLLRNNDVDVLFLDLTMPDIDGVGVLQGIQKLNLDTAVFVISADIQPEMQSKVLQLGAKAFLRKPVNAEVLASNLQEHGYI
ncbi:response regulator [Thalassotalea sp. LPB0316]|uniref:response regulator n=1 Tax=Thalassotalea sp. LPB0316 TaxID=2769490 RepID=UPI00186713E8|nr:response regulator [Thalassotalea sp. LPB0316]QOL25720.1 response regulator [Thalassotalea sp. LPB0316]